MTRNEILDRVNSYDVLAHYLAPFHNEGRLLQGKNISNPFLSEKQKTPSFNIFCDQKGGHEWKYKDFATNDLGSCFDLVMRLFNLDFTAAKQKICDDFNISQREPKGYYTASAPIKESEISTEFSIKTREFTSTELAFWNRYAITEEVLLRYQVKAVEQYTAFNKKGNSYQHHSNTAHPIFAYDFRPQWVKIYKPSDQKYRFQYLGNKQQGFVFGFDQLPDSGEILILTGGEKDVLSLAARGYNAISLNSETARPSADLLGKLQSRFSCLMVLYDNDQTGRKQSEILRQLYRFTEIRLPEIKEGKDISDFFAAGATREELDRIIDEARSNAESAKAAEPANSADFASLASEQNGEIPEEASDELSSMPFLPEWIFNQLPEILRKGSEVFEDRRERDIFLLSAMGILSGCLRQVSGSYNGKTCYANLYVFVIAPPANGKGSLSLARSLGEKLHQSLVKESDRLKKIYQQELQIFKAKLNQKQADIENLEPPVEPPYKVLFFPANSSSARIIELLKEADQQGIFCETEADSMGNVLKQDWGGYSDLLRKAFHHEPVSYSRKTNKAFIEITMPQLSVVLSGTPGQVEGLIKSAEDGLVSRFLFYNFKSSIEWRDAGPTQGGVNLTHHFDVLSEEVLRLAGYLETNGEANFHLSKEQWQLLNEFGRESIGDVTCFVSEEMSSTAKRFGTILFRLSMILTVLRYFEHGEQSADFYCSDEDFRIALAMMMIFKDHSVFTFRKLPKNGGLMDPGLRQFYEALPASFLRKEAIELATKQFNIPERTADSWLVRLKSKKLIEKVRNGSYSKTGK